MDRQPIAESLPERYRRVLDRVADLEAAGRHPEADRVRRDATRSYSRSWTSKTADRLDSLAGRAEHLLRSPAPARLRRRRSGVAAVALVALLAPRRAVARLRAQRRLPIPVEMTPRRPVA
ncbi:MAG: hypothetical protein HY263_01685 [Chloroflexi bacterium]|nr:hypothetical protein [Chloroflexota bacterium]